MYFPLKRTENAKKTILYFLGVQVFKMYVYVTELPLAARVCLSDQSVVCATRISGTGCHIFEWHIRSAKDHPTETGGTRKSLPVGAS